MARLHESPRTVQLLTIRETATLLAVSRATVYRLIAEGDLGAIRVRAHVRVPEADVRALIERRRSQAVTS